ncbi:MAG: hypothetical protein IJR87_06455, partial [Bacteroidaceae bacterium]|nr:hypothetical protein [Bacteroidaceae bacterium]
MENKIKEFVFFLCSFIFSLMSLFAIPLMASEEEGVHRFATFNVRYTNPNNGDTGEKLWANRGPFVGRI